MHVVGAKGALTNPCPASPVKMAGVFNKCMMVCTAITLSVKLFNHVELIVQNVCNCPPMTGTTLGTAKVAEQQLSTVFNGTGGKLFVKKHSLSPIECGATGYVLPATSEYKEGCACA